MFITAQLYLLVDYCCLPENYCELCLVQSNTQTYIMCQLTSGIVIGLERKQNSKKRLH